MKATLISIHSDAIRQNCSQLSLEVIQVKKKNNLRLILISG